jgi:hypothetical protein
MKSFVRHLAFAKLSRFSDGIFSGLLQSQKCADLTIHIHEEQVLLTMKHESFDFWAP